MKVISYKNLCKPKKQKKFCIFCTHSIFKPAVITMSVLICMLVFNLFVGNFFANIKASIEHFVNSFVKFFVE